MMAMAGVSEMSYSAAVLADSPVGYWRLNETSGTTLVDSSGNGLNGTYINSPTLNQSSAVSGGASVLFNGTNQYASIPHDALLDVTHAAGMTVEIWANLVATPASLGTVFGRPVSTSPTNVPYRIYRNTNSPSGLRGGYFVEPGQEPVIMKPALAWHHLVFTVRASGSNRIVETYQNGVLQDTGTFTEDVPVRTSGLFIGAENNRRFVNAYLAEAAVYPTALTAARLLAHYNAATATGTIQTRRRRDLGGFGL